MPFPIILITGQPGVGKTTFIKKVVEKLKQTSFNVCGFYTSEIREMGSRIGFEVVDIGDESKKANLAIARNAQYTGPTVGKYTVLVPQFESVALACFGRTKSKDSVLVIDEIGKMESYSTAFVSSLKHWIEDNRDCPLIATVPVSKATSIPIVDYVVKLATVPILTVTVQNRNSLVDVICDMLTD